MRPTISPTIALAATARRQHGAWSRAQAHRAGFTRAMIRTRVGAGQWLELDAGVFADVTSLPSWHRQVAAAVLAEPWAAASHRAAAALHELSGFRPILVEITVRPGANARGRLALVHRGVDVQTTRIDGIRCSSLAQTFIDLAQVVPERRLTPALDDLAGHRPASLDEIRDRYVLLAPRGGRNLRPLRSVLERYGDGAVPPSSELERALRAVCEHPALPTVTWEAPFPGRQSGRQRIDGLIEPWRLVIEGDGRPWHQRVEDFERDRRRDADAAAAGYQTVRFTWRQLTCEPDWVRSALVATGSHRAAA